MSEKTISETISEKLSKITENTMCMYETFLEVGKKAEYDRFWDEFQQNGNRTNYAYAFGGDGWNDELFVPKYPIKIIDATKTTRNAVGMFYYFHRNDKEPYDMTEICKRIDFSQCKNLSHLFNNAYVKNITVDASNAEDMSQAFSGGDGGAIYSITLTVSERCTQFYNAFHYQTQLTDLMFTEGSVIAASISFDRCRALNRDSVKSILRALKDFTGTGKENTCTVKFHVDVVNQLTEEDIATITQKGWTLVTWTP